MIGGRIDLAQLMSILQGFMSRIVCQSLCPAPPKLSEWSLECLTVLDHSADLSGRQWTRPLKSKVLQEKLESLNLVSGYPEFSVRKNHSV